MTQSMNINHSSFRIESPLSLPEDEVQLWRVDLEAIGPDELRWQKVLSSDESTRAFRFHFSRDRRRYAASRALLRMILAAYLAVDPAELSFSYSDKEKPSLGAAHSGSGVTFNISHSGGIALLAFTRRREIGVDVEQIRSDFDLEGIAQRFFSAHEQQELFALPSEERANGFFRCWTRKEAYIKATGDGLSLPLTQFDVSINASKENALLATRPDRSEAGRWQMREVPAGPGFVAALCVRGQDWKLKHWDSD
ncbi:MAG: 4'-phosphopantetheinyl transferase superfamily protein [Candidatus Sulfotelmatobacter sp.]|jgi:4'-phosphopantetheinyl transferase